MLLRSNNIYLAANLPDTMSLPTGQTPTSSSTHDTPISTTIKLLHQEPSLRRFSGEDTSYSALAFIQQCEDAMRNSNVTSSADKISFVRSQLVPDSLAFDMMLASHFRPDLLNYDYDKFKQNFVNVFGACQRDDSLQFPFRLAESLTTQLGNVGHLRGQARASEIADDAITALEGTWADNGAISLDRLRTVFEILFYVQYLTPVERRIASSLTLKPGDSLYDFSTKLSQKVKESPKVPPVVSAASVSVAPVSAKVPTSSPQQPPQQQPKRYSRTCSYCSKEGHTYKFCFQRKRELRDTKAAATAFSAPCSNRAVQQSAPPKPALRQPSQSVHPLKWCIVHEHGNHATDECFSIMRLKQSQVGQNFPQRPSQNPPS